AFYFSMHPGSSRARAVTRSRGPNGPRGSTGPRPSQAGGSRPAASGSRRSARSPGSASGSPTGRQAGPPSPAPSAGPARSARPAPSAGGAGSAGSPVAPAVERTGSSTVLDFTGPQPVLADTGSLVAGRRARHGDNRHGTPNDAAADRRVAPRGAH